MLILKLTKKCKWLKINIMQQYTWVLLRNGQENGQENGQLEPQLSPG